MNDVADKHSSDASKTSKSLREATEQVMRTTEFKGFCRKEMGSAPSDFIIREYTGKTAAVTEGGLEKCPQDEAAKTEHRQAKFKRVFYPQFFFDSIVTGSRPCSVLAILERWRLGAISTRGYQ